MYKFSDSENEMSILNLSYYYIRKKIIKLLNYIGVNNMKSFTAVFERAEEGGYVCWVEEIPEAMSQGETFEEAKINLLDALKLVIDTNREEAENSIVGRNVIREKIPLSLI